MDPVVLRYDTSAALATEVAARLLSLVQQLQDQERTPQVVLTGGTVAQALYAEIARLAHEYVIDWDAVEFWWGDERFVTPDSPDRNARQAHEAFLNALGATKFHEMPSPNSACSVDEGARAYEAQVRGSSADRFDVVLLSIGPDGHIASLFPGSPEVEVTGRIAVGVTRSPKPPPERITLTLEALSRSDRVWILAADSGPGGAKENAFNRAMAADPEIPATRVRGHLETTWFAS